jgi:hypothetical protein
MSDKLFDKLDEAFNSDDDEEESSDTSNINDALSDNGQYWKSRNQANEVRDALSKDDEDDQS